MILVAGAGGALGGHLVRRLLDDGEDVKAVDIKPFDTWWQFHTQAENLVLDLRYREDCIEAVEDAERVFNLAANMGGIGWIETHHADAMYSVLINTHLIQAAVDEGVSRYFYASSACVYPFMKQSSPDDGYKLLAEKEVWPAFPEPGYGTEKLFSEEMCRYVGEDYNLTTRIGRFHNVYGPHSTWRGGREKAPAALCRKVARAKLKGESAIEVWGDGSYTRSFLYVDDWVEGTMRLMNSDCSDPVNIGSEEVVTVSQLARIVMETAGVDLAIKYDPSMPVGVPGRGSDNTLLRKVTNWEPEVSLRQGLAKTYAWVERQVSENL